MIDHQAKSPFFRKGDAAMLDAIAMISIFLNNGGPEEDADDRATSTLCGIQMALKWVLGIRDEEFETVVGSLVLWMMKKHPEQFVAVPVDDLRPEFDPENN